MAVFRLSLIHICKQVSVNVENSSQPAWVALKLTVSATLDEESKLSEEQAIATIQQMIDKEVDSTKWEKGTDGIYYYQEIVEAGETADHLFNTLTIDGDVWDNDYKGMNFQIKVEAAAVQAANITTADDAKEEIDKLF